MYGETIIERLHENCSLRNENNPLRHIIVNTVGALLDDFDVHQILEAPYLHNAKGSYLDCHGDVVNVSRKLNESDEDYRKRLFYEVLGVLTINYLLTVYDLPLFVYVDDFSVENNTLTSDNPYIADSGFMSIADEETQKILENKFILGSGLKWLQIQ